MAYSNVGFLKGSQTSLNSLLSNGGAKEGIFYLTEDTHRLYIGHDVGNSVIKPVPVNEGIQFVEAQSNLPSYLGNGVTSAPDHAGEFYYINGTNILCVWNGTKWVQINPNTNDNTYITEREIAVSNSSNTATITDTLADNASDEFISTFNIAVNTGLTLGTNNDTITISGDTYALGATATNGVSNSIDLKLDSTNQSDSTVVITAGSSNISLNNTNDGFSIDSVDTQVDEGTLTISPVEDSGNGFNLSFSVVDTKSNEASDSEVLDPVISVGQNSTSSVHFINGTATLPVYSKNDIDSKFQVLNSMHYIGTFKSSGGTAITSIGVNSGKKIDDTNGEITSVKKGADNVDLHIGDTILVAEESTIGGVTYPKGTLFIANGTEATETNQSAGTKEGVITSNSLYFDIVEESYDTDTTYQLTGTNTGFKLVDSDSSDISVVTVTGGTTIGVNSTPSGDNDENVTITINHSDVIRSDPSRATSSQSLNTAYTKTVVTGVTTNSQGHVTGVSTEQMTWTNTNGDIDNITINNGKVAAATNKPKTEGLITVSAAFADSNSGVGDAKSDKFIIASETLEVNTYTSDRTTGDSANKKGLSIELKWGSF